MVNTRKSSRPGSDLFISSRTRSSSRTEMNSEEHKEPSSDVSSPSSPRLAPPSKRTRRQTASEPSSNQAQRVSWEIPTYHTRLSSRIMQNGHAHMSHRNEERGVGDHSHMNGHVELKRSCRVKKSQFEHLNQSLLFDQLVNSTAEAVLQEMDNISSIRQNREVERLRMWTGDTEEENMDMRMKRRKERKILTRKAVQRYEAPPIEPVNRKQSNPSLFDTLRSPARRSHIRVKKHAIHSSDTTSSSDEERFERRKGKSMTRARNSLADVDPMNLDSSVKFDHWEASVTTSSHLKRWLCSHCFILRSLRSLRFSPPEGVCSYGPPGTGKTLVARALANECSQGDKKEPTASASGSGNQNSQLRLLFDQAYLMRPSIIFFDEIDGLAPVRSSRQDQIHSSIVSTLLALMDGLDSRGEIVVIGATNRLGLYRPGTQEAWAL
ncbi:hypothetical protein KUCAC02_020236 [Chaenocephalus aceratus]|uniref:Uncharacterized protein n=1 Tax=Chaenocephalus aceratus TaxID=36190 RepID=A0ACB9VRF2_CHAAC|nr:hypothetical protein KUCAC02_020236 [Chaenocephalus aceratus]